MNGPQRRYQRLEKLVLALFIISRKLKHYFQTFPITVLMEHLLRSAVENPEATRKILKWASELRSYGLRYEPRAIIKGQVLADFINDFPPGATEQANQPEGWILNVDSASNSKGQGSFSPHQKDQLSNNPSLSASRHPTTKPSMKQS